MRYIAAVMAGLLVSVPVGARDAAIAELFSRQGATGAMVIASLRDGRRFTHDDARAGQRFPPASTFKILNTLIALEEQAIDGADSLIKWDGQRHAFPDWNRDQTLESAFKVSCVWCYQTLARRVGADRYRRALRATGFGQLHEPLQVTEFWLDGSLTISANEQVEFLGKLSQRALPFRASSYDGLERIMLVEQAADARLFAKTGWSTLSRPAIGWYVGYVATAGDAWAFAMNLDIRDQHDLALRQSLTRAALRIKGIFPR